MMKYEIIRTAQFKKDYKLSKKRGKDLNMLLKAIEMLANGKKLPEKFKDHQLSGGYIGYRECHIQPDWLLIYKLTEKELVLTLTRTGTHSDLF
ncbi:mRNA interferase YafQ [Dethiosulfatibacter aminovorans DSM 17477]|uniref:mRNA interferase YafQ n=2 Tax=Dethiosulfatibacter TaxID=448125 RepID=A0A1M6GAB8_9FIRM|nr:mRNA interferase YafQ [Dethiosulfatibacter aminovorans DSM 17477]